jgi:capsular polysaccharide biosynthesis protein
MKKSLIQFYRIHLKKYFFFRLLRDAYFKYKHKKIFSHILIKLKYKKFIFISYSNYLNLKKVNSKEIESEYKYRHLNFNSIPRFYEKKYPIEFDNLLFPKVISFNLKNSIAIHNCSFIIKDDYCIHNDLINLEYEEIWEISSGYLKKEKNKILINIPSKETIIEKGIHLINPLNTNYAHFILETLSKLSSINLLIYKDYFIVINENLHENVYRLINLATNYSLKIYKINPNEKLVIRDCLIISPTAKVIFNHKNLSSARLKFSDAYYNLNLIHKLSLNIINNTKNANNANISIKKSDKIFLVRRQTYNKKIINYEDVINYFRNNGFLIIDPEEMSISSLIVLINNAKLLVTQAGSGLINMIFASDNTKIYVLAGWAGKYGNCHFFYNAIYQSNLQLTFLLFKPHILSKDIIHADFFVNLKYLDAIIQKRKLF